MEDIIIIGKGPAGISASLYIARSGLSVRVIGADFGALAKTDKIENYYGFSGGISGEALIEEGIHQAEALGVKITTAEAVGLSYDGDFIVRVKNGEYRAKSLILATGTARKAPVIPGIREFEGMGVSYCAVCDAFFFRGKDVCVLGSGDYAFHECSEILPVVGTVTLLTNGSSLQGEAPDGVTVETGKIEAFEGDGALSSVRFQDGRKLDTACVFVALGTASSSDFAKKLGVETDGGKMIVDENMATSVPGLFACGDCTGGMLQIAKAVYEGAAAGISAIRFVRGRA